MATVLWGVLWRHWSLSITKRCDSRRWIDGWYQAVRSSELSYYFLSPQPASGREVTAAAITITQRQLNYDDGHPEHHPGPFINCHNCKLNPPDTSSNSAARTHSLLSATILSLAGIMVPDQRRCVDQIDCHCWNNSDTELIINTSPVTPQYLDDPC